MEAFRFCIERDKFVVLSFGLPDRNAGSAQISGLTASERDVAKLVVLGRSNAEIAHLRSSSVQTVANQLATIYRKLGVTSRRELRALRSLLPSPARG
jgi:DNA-binding CsgD family transcriptional regulator